ncbi:hypothetical protein IJ670_03470 [bacterium]|nr:hypothetical protein [bacterium]
MKSNEQLFAQFYAEHDGDFPTSFKGSDGNSTTGYYGMDGNGKWGYFADKDLTQKLQNGYWSDYDDYLKNPNSSVHQGISSTELAYQRTGHIYLGSGSYLDFEDKGANTGNIRRISTSSSSESSSSGGATYNYVDLQKNLSNYSKEQLISDYQAIMRNRGLRPKFMPQWYYEFLQQMEIKNLNISK